MAKKLAKMFSLIFFAAFLASCDRGCVAEDEFAGYSIEVQSNPGSDKITGTYDGGYDSVNDDVTGGQKVQWVDTKLRSNGEQFLIQITGAWTPWFGDSTPLPDFKTLPKCNFCARIDGVPNCLCYNDQVSEREVSSDGYTLVSADCSKGGPDEDDASKCTCTTTQGSADNYEVYHVPLNYEDKFGNVKDADQQDPCQYDGGMGLYLGLFGRSGNDTPTRVYHLFTQEAVCDVGFDDNGECLDDNGRDATKHIFRSRNQTIFVKDDNNGNDRDDDKYGHGATMHTANENVRLIIYDSFYLDNSGSYNVTFFNGVGDTEDSGLLEYLVNMFEDVVLGEVDKNNCVLVVETGKERCERTGGVIEFMYKSIVTDQQFVRVFQILLSLYIAFYGAATLMGVADINRKELMMRIVKVGLVMLFTAESSWVLYDEIIIHFFKDSMDYVVGIFMNLSDSNLGGNTSSILIAQMDRASDSSNATRFSYIDLTIAKLLSLAAAKKIFGLFFGTFFGFLYIFIIYGLIAFFIYVMLLAASFYVINLMKLILVLALGPIFMCFSLFSYTNSIFKKWISFLGSRSLEVVILFAVLYNFVLIVDMKFTALLYYKACVEMWDLWLFTIPILKSHIDRSLVAWCSDFVVLGGLIFITKLIVDQIPSLSGYLISIGGDANKDGDGVGRGQSSMNLANRMMGGGKNAAGRAERGLLDLAGGVGKRATTAAYVSGGAAVQGGTAVYRSAKSAAAKSSMGRAIANSTVGKVASSISNKLPSGPRDAYRNRLINAAADKAAKEAKAQGLTGKDASAFIRKSTISSLQTKMHRDNKAMAKQGEKKVYDPTGMKYADINMTSILRELDKRDERSLKSFLEKEADKLKSSGANALFGEKLNAKLNEAGKKWCEENLSCGKDKIAQHLNNSKGLIKGLSVMKTEDAAKAFAGNKKLQSEYLKDLENNRFKASQKGGGYAKQASNYFKYGKEVADPDAARNAFLNQVMMHEKNMKSSYADQRGLDLDPLKETRADTIRNVLNQEDNVGQSVAAVNKEHDDRITAELGGAKQVERNGQMVTEYGAVTAAEHQRDEKTKEFDGQISALKAEQEKKNKIYADAIKGGARKSDEKRKMNESYDQRIAKLKKQKTSSIKAHDNKIAALGVKAKEIEKSRADKLNASQQDHALFKDKKVPFFKDEMKKAVRQDINTQLKPFSDENKDDRAAAIMEKAINDFREAKSLQKDLEKTLDKDSLEGELAANELLEITLADGRKTTLLEERERIEHIKEMTQDYDHIDVDVLKAAETPQEKAKADQEALDELVEQRGKDDEFDKAIADKKALDDFVAQKEEQQKRIEEQMLMHKRAEEEIARKDQEEITRLEDELVDKKEQERLALEEDLAKQASLIYDQQEAQNKVAIEEAQKATAAAQKKLDRTKQLKEAESIIRQQTQEVAQAQTQLVLMRPDLVSAENQKDMEKERAKLNEKLAASYQEISQAQEARDNVILAHNMDRNQEEIDQIRAEKEALEAQRERKIETSDNPFYTGMEEDENNIAALHARQNAAEELQQSLLEVQKAKDEVQQIRNMEILAFSPEQKEELTKELKEEEDQALQVVAQARQKAEIAEKQYQDLKKSQKVAVAADKNKTSLDQAKFKTETSKGKLEGIDKNIADLRGEQTRAQERVTQLESSQGDVRDEHKQAIKDVIASNIAIKAMARDRKEADSELLQDRRAEFIQEKTNKVYESEQSLQAAEKEYMDFRQNMEGKAMTDEDMVEDMRLRENLGTAQKTAIYSKYEFLDSQQDALHVTMEEAELANNQDLSDDEVRQQAEETSQALHDVLDGLESSQESVNDLPESKEDSLDKALDKDFKDDGLIIKGYETDRMQKAAKARLAQLDLNIRKSELSKLQMKDPASLTIEESSRISALEQEISKIESDARRYEQEVSQIDQKLMSA